MYKVWWLLTAINNFTRLFIIQVSLPTDPPPLLPLQALSIQPRHAPCSTSSAPAPPAVGAFCALEALSGMVKKHKNNNSDGERKGAFHDIKRDHEPGAFVATLGASAAQAPITHQTQSVVTSTSRTPTIAKPIPLPPYFGTTSSKQASAHSGNQYPLTDRLRNLVVREPFGVNGKSRSSW